MLQIKFCSIMVDDQEKALAFYTDILGFEKMADIPFGEFRWLTVVAKGSENIEVVLEPMAFPPAVVYQKALFDAGIPWTAFNTEDMAAEYERLKALGVVFRSEPQEMGPILSTVFEDTCGNLINLVQAV